MEETKIVLDETALEKFDPTVAQLKELVGQSSGIQAVDLKDKVQLEIVKNSRIKLKKTRVEIEKYGKTLRDDANKFAKAVIAKEKELIGIIEPEEIRLADIEKEAEQLAIIEERKVKLPERKERLATIGDGVDVSDDHLLSLDATAFEAYYNERLGKKLAEDKEKQEADLREREARIREQEEAVKKEAEKLEIEKAARKREERAREEERAKLHKEEEERVRSQKQAEEEQLKNEKEAQERLEKEKRYREWRKGLGWTPEDSKYSFKEIRNGDFVELWRKVGEFRI